MISWASEIAFNFKEIHSGAYMAFSNYALDCQRKNTGVNKYRHSRVLSAFSQSCSTMVHINSGSQQGVTLLLSVVLGQEFLEKIVSVAYWQSDPRGRHLDIKGSPDWF
jgi:hypothetical protein